MHAATLWEGRAYAFDRYIRRQLAPSLGRSFIFYFFPPTLAIPGVLLRGFLWARAKCPPREVWVPPRRHYTRPARGSAYMVDCKKMECVKSLARCSPARVRVLKASTELAWQREDRWAFHRRCLVLLWALERGLWRRSLCWTATVRWRENMSMDLESWSWRVFTCFEGLPTSDVCFRCAMGVGHGDPQYIYHTCFEGPPRRCLLPLCDGGRTRWTHGA